MRWLSDALQDARFAGRTLAKNPGFAAVALITLTLGIGANAAIFTLFDAILLRSLPVRDPHRLVLFSDSLAEGTQTGNAPTGRWQLFSYEALTFLRGQPLPFESIAAVRSGASSVLFHLAAADSSSQARRARVQLVSGDYFRAMGVDAAIGRALTAADERRNAPPVAVVSHTFWRDGLGSSPAAIGAVAILNRTAFTIVGVGPPAFFGERIRRAPDFWVPLTFQPQIELRSSYVDQKDAYWLNLVARLRPDATRAQAQAAATIALRHFTETADARIELADGAAGVSPLRRLYSEPLHVLLVVVALVLLIACANVGNLLLARALARQNEIAMRIALGASRARLIRQLLVESAVVAILASICGIVLARWTVAGLLTLVVTPGTPVAAQINGSVLAFTIGVAVIATLAFGLVPVVHACRSDLANAVKPGQATRPRGRFALAGDEALISLQVAISLVLLVGANLFGRSLLNLQSQPLGFQPDGVLTARLNPRLAGYRPGAVRDVYRDIQNRLSGVPSMTSATLARYSPLSGGRSLLAATVEGYVPRPDEPISFEVVLVGPSYPETLGIELLQGRAIDAGDTAGRPRVAMVNEAFVRQYFPDRLPIGRRIGVEGSEGPTDIEVVGVLRDAQFHDARDAIKPIAFTAILQDAGQSALDCEIEVRAAADMSRVAADLRRTLAEVDKSLPVDDVQSLREQVDRTFRSDRLAALFVGFFGGLALTLAAFGLYGTIAHTVARRTSEIGVRMALGANRRDVLWMIARKTLLLLAVGLAAGAPAAFLAGRLVAHQLFGLSAADPQSFAIAGVLLSAVAVLAGLIPARQATRVDPAIALRHL